MESKIEKVEVNIFNKEEIIENCTVQIWENTITGDVSVAWWRGKKEDMPGLVVRGESNE